MCDTMGSMRGKVRMLDQTYFATFRHDKLVLLKWPGQFFESFPLSALKLSRTGQLKP